jgi:hypothetical protein
MTDVTPAHGPTGGSTSTPQPLKGTPSRKQNLIKSLRRPPDLLSAVAELRRTQTMSRDAWQIRVETQMRLSSTANAFLLQGGLRAWEGANEVCHREWDRSIPRDFM